MAWDDVRMDLWTLSDLATPWAVHVVATLRVANHIEAGHTAIADLARAAKADPEYLGRVLHHLVSKGLFAEPQPGVFALNELARGLLGDVSGFDLDSFGARMAHSWGTLLSAVRTGKPAYHEAFGLPFWDDLAAHPKLAESFNQLMSYAGHGTPDPNILIDPADWAGIKTVVDVGGGTGALLAEILRAHPHVHGTLVDLPGTVAESRAVFEAAGVAGRATLVGQSFFDPLPAGADVYTLRKVLGDWPDTEARAILARCADAARRTDGTPSGRVVVFTEAGPGESGGAELLMLVLLGGKGRSADELQVLGREAGLEMRATGRQASGKVLVEFVPV